MSKKTNEELLAMLLAEIRELRAQVSVLGQVKNQEEGCKLLFDFSKIRKQDVMMCFVELYERFAIFGTKDHLQSFLSKQTNLGTKASVDRLYNRCMKLRLRK
ncbi:MAG: hypothetical protein J5502_02965 [Prevotella sp.]|nr:hypothetical protein [Prevotella sp.]